MSTYFHVGFNFQGKPPKDNELEEIFNQAQDWLRYAPTNWIIYTNESLEIWTNRLRSQLSDTYTILLFEIDLKRHRGWAPTMVVDWLKKQRG